MCYIYTRIPLTSNYNFSGLTYDGSDNNGGGGCLYKIGASMTINNDEYIPVVKGQLYRLTYDLKPNYDFSTAGDDSSGINGFLPFIDQYDIDRNRIADVNTNYKAGTLVQLAEDLISGASSMKLTDASAWTTFSSVNATMQIWDYVSSTGYHYGPGEYTRHIFVMGTGSTCDQATNTITFQNVYIGSTIPAGTWVSQNRGGGFAYIGSYDKPAAQVWSSWTHDTTSSTIRGGCAFAKIGMLFNYNVNNTRAVTHDSTVAYTAGRSVKAVEDGKTYYYIALKDVPVNTPLTNTNYWVKGTTVGSLVTTKITNIQFGAK